MQITAGGKKFTTDDIAEVHLLEARGPMMRTLTAHNGTSSTRESYRIPAAERMVLISLTGGRTVTITGEMETARVLNLIREAAGIDVPKPDWAGHG